MSWVFKQSTGEIFRSHVFTMDKGCAPLGIGYSGYQQGKNNPDMQNLCDLGPIPRGRWVIASMLPETADHGPYVLRLIPDCTTPTFGRRGFLIHGDSLQHPGEASLGCIVLPHIVRVQIWQSGDHDLEVIA